MTTLTQLDIAKLPHYKQKTKKEYSAACPFCQAGEDRFLFWPDKGNYFCRKCGAKGFIENSDRLTFTQEQYESWKRAEVERERKEQEEIASNIERLSRSDKAEYYHRQMLQRDYWYSQGLSDETINRFKLGYAPACPTFPDSPSWTIPIYYKGKLYNIRHRLANPKDSGKYRPEFAGLPATIFNADALSSGDWMTVLVEGEVKAMVLTQHGLNAVGIPGANSFKDKWVKLFQPIGTVYIALDPGAEIQAREIATVLQGNGINTRLCYVPVKPDDFLVKYGGTSNELFRFLMLGEKVK